jgi:hypothetical protein
MPLKLWAERLTRGILGCFAVATIGAWMVVAGAYVIGRLHLGHWPRPDIDDPKFLHLGVWYVSAKWAVVVLLCSFLAIPIFSMPYLWWGGRRGRRAALLALVVALASLGLHLGLPLTGWILD